MKSRLLVLISVVIILGVGISFTFKDTCFNKENIPAFLQSKLKSMGIQGINIKDERTINNKYIVIFNYLDRTSSECTGISTFEIKSHNRYKYEKFNGNSFGINGNGIITNDEKGNINAYSIFYGVVGDDIPNKYKVSYSGKTQIEEIPRNEFFAKYYLIGDSNGVRIEPIENNNWS